MTGAGPAWVPPWLAHLRRDARGLPVPFVNRWGPEDVSRIAIRDDTTVRGLAVYFDDDDQQVPDFTAQSPQRQRWSMFHGLCQVCGREVPWPRRYLVLSSISVDQIEVEGQQRVALTEPWLDAQCAQLAIEHCPGLIRRRRDEDLSLISVESPRDYELAVSRGWVEGALEDESRRVSPAMWVKVLLPPGSVAVR